MKRFLGDRFDSFDKTLFTHLFYQRLPPALQRNFFSVKYKLPLNDLAQLADDYMASIPAEPLPSVANVASTSDTQQLVHQISQLSLKVNTLEEQFSNTIRRRSRSPRSPSPRRFRYRSKSRDRPARTPGVCYYHNRFGSDAIKCHKPCIFHGQSLNGTSGC